jgi:hypothetical protein
MLREVPLADLASRCREETLRFLRGEPRDDTYCFEVFQRAVVERDNQAWEALVGQYRGIVLAYVSQHSAAAMIGESDDYWVNRAFQRFWTAVGADRFAQFPDLPALLRYLKLCVHSVLMDEVRSRRARTCASLDDVSDSLPSVASAERNVLGDLGGEQLWQAIVGLLRDEREKQVAYLSFTRDLKPAEIFDRSPELFPSVADVYRVKRNLIERLRNSQVIREFLPA